MRVTNSGQPSVASSSLVGPSEVDCGGRDSPCTEVTDPVEDDQRRLSPISLGDVEDSLDPHPGHSHYLEEESLKVKGVSPADWFPDDRPIILLVGFFELSLEECRQVRALSDARRATHSGYRDTLRIHALRTVLGPSVVVLSVTAPGRFIGLSRYCFEITYNDRMSLSAVRDRGFSGKVCHVFIDFGQRMLVGYLDQWFSKPLAIFSSCPEDVSTDCAVWLGLPPSGTAVDMLCQHSKASLIPTVCRVPANLCPLYVASEYVGFPNFEALFGGTTSFAVLSGPFHARDHPAGSLKTQLSAMATTVGGLPLQCRVPEVPFAVPSYLCPQAKVSRLPRKKPVLVAPAARKITPPPRSPRKAKPNPPQTVPPRRGPARSGRPSSYSDAAKDLPLLGADEILPGHVPRECVPPPDPFVVIQQSAGDHPDTWVGASVHQISAKRGLFTRFGASGAPTRFRICKYYGVSNGDLKLSYREAKRQWERQGNDYIFGDPAHGYIVKGSMACPGVYANEGFRKANCYLWYSPVDKCVYLCLRGAAKAGVYECMVNYSTPGEVSDFWSLEKLERLEPAVRRECEEFYGLVSNPRSVMSGMRSLSEFSPGRYSGETQDNWCT